MRCVNEKDRCGGFSLMEILITLVILTIVAAMGITTFRGLDEKYDVETETKQLYTDLMKLRGMASQRCRAAFVVLRQDGYSTYEDTNPVPDGNGVLETGSDRRVTDVTLSHGPLPALAGTFTAAGGVTTFGFDHNGIPAATGSIRFASNVEPDYDCISIRPTMIKMGQYIGGVCVEK